MARNNQNARPMRESSSKAGLILGSAIASLALASCASSAPPAQVSLAKAQSALESGKVDKAIIFAEAAVLASPRDPEYRATLGAAYLEAGRYESAATAFGEAIELGDIRGKTTLSYALTKVAMGDNRAAVTALQARQNSIPNADLGLALALAGEAERGVKILVDTIREGNSSPKARQNLAYAYALSGNWRAARVMASEDVPANQLDARLSDWAATARPDDYLVRISNLLGLKPGNDGGLPQHLALANFPSQPELVAEAAQMAKAEPAPVAAPTASQSAPQPNEALAFGAGRFDEVTHNTKAAAPAPSRAAPSPAPSVGPRYVSNAVVQKIPGSTNAGPSNSGSTAQAPSSAGTHHVQLGAFNSREVAEQKWREFQRRYPGLKGRDVVITEARVKGRTFFRVAAAGFGERDARSMCGSVKASGGGCFAYAKSSPPAGAVERNVRVASRAR